MPLELVLSDMIKNKEMLEELNNSTMLSSIKKILTLSVKMIFLNLLEVESKKLCKNKPKKPPYTPLKTTLTQMEIQDNPLDYTKLQLKLNPNKKILSLDISSKLLPISLP